MYADQDKPVKQKEKLELGIAGRCHVILLNRVGTTRRAVSYFV